MFRTYYVHASYSYSPLGVFHYIKAVKDLILARIVNAINITFHFPIELAFPSSINTKRGIVYINWVEFWAKKLKVVVVWENISLLKKTDWSLLEQSTWEYIPKRINLCLDTGHLILGEKNPRKRILEIIKKYGRRIKHLHLHENDLKRDLHLPPGKILKPLFNLLIKGRTWIIEPIS
ncbi:hypothetical protein A3C98_03980 [Candidatus Roizmanbacteria bacterium RIFCSPHIGHO2_02_FULL_37_15]|uniref:Xylose isomerase-like TIM barrel domain-containing protein n=1 Tax=Candidatus Roizmanbacteria bacterium RIFCSPLOWO2_01_FULL_37_16 TaxID=1802058 RepID=A0A1F7IMR0_9BACT|nr:MAG: hypothetical protein A2859_04280 [Candidatus Roizmanbacteria bacterium RIFCSPHIGHO2_01_FULL_37_16b]OGK22482.1 MAG: hypothetical protein A3C98_03980 [Candidatus Roizmanbacteria bacterium RIFCSPHIGHO2_02_FULL_37_15]OGK33542.1 MAG: hypothetical protein A3F57_05550 [Candidatus Roizmanbacteria bacterium RIFCSPHIGHO2_12_FULL_36_11]OGK44590.1 MAG: hypothetical protein A3B40_05400 [Candidatus Roizmanbacteria bacterium RIFCSPLOWO2_01_FULL_37_16]